MVLALPARPGARAGLLYPCASKEEQARGQASSQGSDRVSDRVSDQGVGVWRSLSYPQIPRINPWERRKHRADMVEQAHASLPMLGEHEQAYKADSSDFNLLFNRRYTQMMGRLAGKVEEYWQPAMRWQQRGALPHTSQASEMQTSPLQTISVQESAFLALLARLGPPHFASATSDLVNNLHKFVSSAQSTESLFSQGCVQEARQLIFALAEVQECNERLRLLNILDELPKILDELPKVLRQTRSLFALAFPQDTFFAKGLAQVEFVDKQRQILSSLSFVAEYFDNFLDDLRKTGLQKTVSSPNAQGRTRIAHRVKEEKPALAS